jgi:hypothetical protein
MRLKLMKISTKSFIIVFSAINVIAGFMLGAVVTMFAVLVPDDQGAGVFGVWSILVFPILNGILGVITGAFLTGAYNFFAKRLGGVEIEFENL